VRPIPVQRYFHYSFAVWRQSAGDRCAASTCDGRTEKYFVNPIARRYEDFIPGGTSTINYP
jgi:hypothetical protein